MTQDRIVVVGSQSRLGRALVEKLGARARPIARHAGGDPRTLVVPDYHAIRAIDLDGAAAVINCTGLVIGPRDALEHANATLPALLAARSREARVPRFVQISSFSVYGHAETITAETPELPVTDYGRTKLAGDAALAAAASPDFSPVMLRIPMLIDTSENNKLATLIRLMLCARIVLAPAPPVVRAMLSYADAANAAIALADGTQAGVVLAADPVPFTYDLIAERIAAVTEGRVRRLPVPRMLGRLLALARPNLHASLLQSSRLPNAANFVRESAPPTALPAVITRLIEKMASGSA